MPSESSVPPSRLSADKLGLVTKIARMYHEQGIRQPEIAERLSISQSRVSRFLKEAVNLGVVRTIVVPPPGVHPELEDRVRLRFGLSDVVVAGSHGADQYAIQSALGAAGAAYLETTLTGSDRIGISSWSSTLLATVDAMLPRTIRSADSIVQVLGGVGNPQVQMQATRLADRLAGVTGASPRFVAAPGIVATPALRDALLQDEYIAEVASAWNDLSLLLVGIGSMQPSPLLKDSGNSLSIDELEALRAAGAVGDVCLRFFDTHGALVQSSLNERVLGISVDALRAVGRRVGIAGGESKHEAIRAAAQGGWINVLITDVATAEFLIS